MRDNYIQHNRPKLTVLNEEQCKAIFNAACRILEITGVEMQNEKARNILKEAGCWIEGKRVHFPKNLIEKCIDLTPKTSTFYDQNGNVSQINEIGRSYYGPDSTSLYVRDLETGEKRRTTKQDNINVIRLLDALPNIDWITGFSMADDEVPEMEELHEVYLMMTNSSKHIYTWCQHIDNLKDMFDMCAVISGSHENFRRKPFLHTVVCPTTPLLWEEDIVDQLMYIAENGYLLSPGHETVIGSLGPCTMAGTIALNMCAPLTAIVLAQTINPGTVVTPGGYIDSTDMMSAQVMTGGPEYTLTSVGMTEVWNSLGIPAGSHTGGASTSPVFDQQAAFEHSNEVFCGMAAGVTTNSLAGFLESDNSGSLEALCFIDEVIGYSRKFVEGIEVNDETLALDVINEIGPEGDYLTHPHTMRHFKELWRGTTMKVQTNEEFEINGSKDLGMRYNEKVKEILAKGNQRELPEDAVKKLEAILDRARKRVSAKN